MATRKKIIGGELTVKASGKTAASKVTITKKLAPKKTATAPAAASKTAVAKKAAKTAKVASKKTKKRAVVVAPEERAFWVNNGEVLHSLVDLGSCLPGMTARVYRFHADPDHHDFALWVAHVLLDPQCAAALRSAASVTAAELVVVKHLKRYAL